MYFNKVMGRTGGMPFKGQNGTKGQDAVPRQYQLNIAEPSIKSVGTLRGASASAAPIVAVNKERYDNRQPSKQYETKTSSGNLTFFLDFRDALKQVSGSDDNNYNATTSLISLKPKSKPVPTHSTPIHKSMPLFVQACIDTTYGKDNDLYDNTSKTRKFSTPAHGKLVPNRKNLFGLLMDDLSRIENGQFPVHEEWFDSFGIKMTPSKAHKLISLLDRIARLIGFMSENNTWLGKGSQHMLSIMNALLVKNLLNPKTYNKQKYFSFFYHINEQAYDDNHGRAIRGETKPVPLKDAQLPTLPFPSPYIRDILLSFRQEQEAAMKDLIAQNELAAQMLTTSLLRALPFPDIDNTELDTLKGRMKGSKKLSQEIFLYNINNQDFPLSNASLDELATIQENRQLKRELSTKMNMYRREHQAGSNARREVLREKNVKQNAQEAYERSHIVYPSQQFTKSISQRLRSAGANVLSTIASPLRPPTTPTRSLVLQPSASPSPSTSTPTSISTLFTSPARSRTPSQMMSPIQESPSILRGLNIFEE